MSLRTFHRAYTVQTLTSDSLMKFGRLEKQLLHNEFFVNYFIAASEPNVISDHVVKDCHDAKCATNGQERAALPLNGESVGKNGHGTEGALDGKLEVAVHRSRRDAVGFG